MTEANTQVSEDIKEVVVDDATAQNDQTDTTGETTQQDGKQADADTGAADAGTDDASGDDGDKPSALPDNWRELAAGEDEDALKLLKRYGSMNGVVKALIEKEKLIRSGKIKRDMPDPKDEKAMAEWRKDQGIPDSAEGYKLPDTVSKRLIDEDKPILASFTEFAHAKNLPPSAVDAAAEWYVNMNEAAAEAQGKADTEAREAAEDSLRDTWSRDEYKGNMTLAKRFWESTGIPDLSEARLPDGRKIGNLAEFITFSSDRGREAFGDVVFSSSDSEQRHNNRRDEIEKIRNTDFDAYDNDPKMKAEYQGIIDRDLQRTKKK